jgi:hypothetical protein
MHSKWENRISRKPEFFSGLLNLHRKQILFEQHIQEDAFIGLEKFSNFFNDVLKFSPQKYIFKKG